VPVLDNDQVIAVIDLESRHPGAFDAGEIDFVQAIAAQAVTLRRAAELQKTRKWLDEERKLLVRINSIAQEAEKQGEMAVLKRILDALAQYIEAPFISIHLLTRDGYSFDQARSLSIPDDHSYLRGLNLENSILGRAVQGARERGDKHRLIENVHHPPAGWPPSRRHHADARMAKLVVFLGEGQEMVGVINVEHPDHTVLHRQVGLIEAVGVGVHNALALSDAANRRAGQDFRERIAQETDELIQLLTSTVFHDAPQLVRALQLRLDDLENACYDRGAAFPERAQVEKKWAETRATADRLGRLSAALPSYMRPDRLDLVQIVQETFAAPVLPALSFFEEVRCAVELDVPSSSLYVSESASWLRHILENLAVNAFRALSEHPNPEPKLVVSACTSADGQRVVVQIDDNGPGLPTEVAKKIGLERIASEGRPEQLGIFHQFARKHVQRQGGELVPGRSRLGGCMFELRYPRLT